MKKLHVVIGDSGTRKSSLIRCLSGAGSADPSKILDIEYQNGRIAKVHVILSALQESYKPQLPSDVVEYVSNHPADEFLLPLRVNSVSTKGKNYPVANTYLNAFVQAGLQIESVALLGVSAQQVTIPVQCKIAKEPKSQIIPTNKIASTVRNIWNWV
ncbi:hypothetical protein [Vibrio cholerae]|uniref:hypothetical protein n=1 Tax=Vibrio cholerae TaxID=666 RepID=UPI0034DA8FE7